MKRSDIVVGGVYNNGSTGIKSPGDYEERKIIAEGPRYITYTNQKDTDCICYEVVLGKRKGHTNVLTRKNFSTWAKERVR